MNELQRTAPPVQHVAPEKTCRVCDWILIIILAAGLVAWVLDGFKAIPAQPYGTGASQYERY